MPRWRWTRRAANRWGSRYRWDSSDGSSVCKRALAVSSSDGRQAAPDREGLLLAIAFSELSVTVLNPDLATSEIVSDFLGSVDRFVLCLGDSARALMIIFDDGPALGTLHNVTVVVVPFTHSSNSFQS